VTHLRNERVALVSFVGRRSQRELLPHINLCVLLDVGKNTLFQVLSENWVMQIRGSIVVSISARHAEDPGSIPGRGVLVDRNVYGLELWVLRLRFVFAKVRVQNAG
jgi:hypothetical protein